MGGFRRNHLGARLMIPCRETIGGDPAVRGYRCAQPPGNLDFFLAEKSCQFSVVRFQISERIQRDRRSKEILVLSVFNRYCVAVGAPGRAPVMRGRVFPEGNHQSRSVMIPPETSALWLAFRGYRCAQPPAIYGFFPAGKGVGSWQISDFSHQRAARSCRGARDAR